MSPNSHARRAAAAQRAADRKAVAERAAALRRSAERAAARRRSAIIAGVLVVAVLLGALVWVLLTRAGASSTQASGAAVTRDSSYVLDDGGPGAPVLVEFMDFECEACGAFYPVVEQLREQYRGKFTYVIRYFPIASHTNSMNAALAVEAAAQQDRLEDMYSRMFETQTQWGEQQTSRADVFRGYAEDLGLDMAAYDSAITDPASTQRIELDQGDGTALGVQGTPTFFLDGEKLELNALSDLADALETAISQADR